MSGHVGYEIVIACMNLLSQYLRLGDVTKVSLCYHSHKVSMVM